MCSYKKIPPWESVWNPKTYLLQTSPLRPWSQIILKPTDMESKGRDSGNAGEKCPAVIVHTCGWGWRCRWGVPPPSPTISSIWPSGWPGENFQTSPGATSASSLCGIRDIPAWMRSKGDSSAQGYHHPGVCPTQLFHEALLAQIKPPTPLSTWNVLEEQPNRGKACPATHPSMTYSLIAYLHHANKG